MCKASPVLFVSGDKRVSKSGFVWQTVRLCHNASQVPILDSIRVSTSVIILPSDNKSPLGESFS